MSFATGTFDIQTLSSPNIIQFFGVGQLRTDIGLVMELCDTDLKKMSQQIEQSGEALVRIVYFICIFQHLLCKECCWFCTKTKFIVLLTNKA